MPLGEFDVIKALSDSLLKRIDFFVDDFHIRVEAYQRISDLIEDEQILVVEGKDPNKSTYNPATDTIATRYGANSPAGLDDRAMLIHECTHAIKDMEHVTITALGNEAAAYIAEATYLLLSDTNYTSTGDLHKGALDVARRFELHTTQGMRKHIDTSEIGPLFKTIANSPTYRQDIGQLSLADGISPKIRQHWPTSPPEPESTPDRATAQEESVPLSDSYLISLLQPRYAADDVAGFGARARKLEQVVRSASVGQAIPLFPRLLTRRIGDKVSVLFHDHLSTATRTKVLRILQDRMAGK